jgi:phosphatidylinositol 4-phosphatase
VLAQFRPAILNVAEQHGREGIIVSAYRQAAERLARDDVVYKEWDFHKECKGMRFENVSRLVSLIEPDMDKMGCVSLDTVPFRRMSKMHSYFECTSSRLLNTQQGAFRTNCMDCLDRTNVVQSALARKQLSLFLQKEQLGAVPHEALDLAFNDCASHTLTLAGVELDETHSVGQQRRCHQPRIRRHIRSQRRLCTHRQTQPAGSNQ